MGIVRKLLGGFTVVTTSAIAYVGYDVQCHRIYPDEPFGLALRHYLSIRSLGVIGKVMKQKLDKATRDVEAVQRDFLLRQIRENVNTEYAKDMQLDQVKSVADFISLHPLTRYNDYSRYISRMMSGETNVLTATEPSIFAVTSGTSGSGNIIPMVEKQTKLFFVEGISILYTCMTKAFPDTKFLNKALKIFYSPTWRYSVTGIRIGPNSASPDRSQSLLHIYTTPPPVYGIKSEPEALYLYLLFALLDCDMGHIEANFASIVFNAFNVLEANLEQLTEDIEKGRVDPNLDIDPDIRKEIEQQMKPNPERASEIRKAAEGGRVGLALRIWPHLHMLMGADTGSFDLYGERLRSGYCQGVPLYSPIYAASEGLLGVNIWPNHLPSRYLLHPRTQFFEFIPEERMSEEQPSTLLMHQVKEEQMYELVITNPTCLYRYRFGDVVKVVGFYNQCPVVEFKYRKGQFLNVRGEKTSESMFYQALKGAIQSIWEDVQLADYCCAESVMLEELNVPKSMRPTSPCYHVFLELDSEQEGEIVKNISHKHKKMLDDALMVHSYPYSSFRHKGSISPIQVHLVRKGSFGDLRQFMLEQTSATSNQYKVPRVLRRQEAVKFMLERVIG